MKTRLSLLAAVAMTLTACESAFDEPDFPQPSADVQEEATRNMDASDSTGSSGFTIELEDENEIDLDFTV